MINENFVEHLEKKYSNHKWFDKAIKDSDLDETNGLFKLFKLNLFITTFERTEHTTIKKGERRADLVGRNEWKYFVHIEASKNPPYYYDFIREIEYDHRIYMSGWRENPTDEIWKDEKNYCPIISVFLTAGKIRDQNIFIDYQKKNNGNEIHLRSFYNLDAENILNKINTKVKNNKQLDWDEVQFLKFIVTTNLNMKNHEKILTAIKILNKDQSIPEKIKEKIMAIYICNVVTEVKNKKEKLKILERICMSTVKEFVSDLIIEAKKSQEREEGMKKGMKKGMEKGVENVAKTMLDKGYKMEEVADITGLALNTLMKL